MSGFRLFLLLRPPSGVPVSPEADLLSPSSRTGSVSDFLPRSQLWCGSQSVRTCEVTSLPLDVLIVVDFPSFEVRSAFAVPNPFASACRWLRAVPTPPRSNSLLCPLVPPLFFALFFSSERWHLYPNLFSRKVDLSFPPLVTFLFPAVLDRLTYSLVPFLSFQSRKRRPLSQARAVPPVAVNSFSSLSP